MRFPQPELADTNDSVYREDRITESEGEYYMENGIFISISCSSDSCCLAWGQPSHWTIHTNDQRPIARRIKIERFLFKQLVRQSDVENGVTSSDSVTKQNAKKHYVKNPTWNLTWTRISKPEK